jgi:hypothetical protein
MRTYAPRNRVTLIEQKNQNSLTHLLKNSMTVLEKRELVVARNPYLFIFGDKLVPQGGQDYATYINKLYIGESK